MPKNEQLELDLSTASYLDEERRSPFVVEIPAHFRGPLDTLLFLIKAHKLDVYNIPIAFILERYHVELEAIKRLNLQNVGEHLEMVATLMELKSRLLLPPDPTAEEELDPRHALVQQLLSLHKRDALGVVLREMEYDRSQLWSRDFLDIPDEVPMDDEVVFEAGLSDLLSAWEEMTARMRHRQSGTLRISLDTLNLQERISEVLRIFEHFQQVTFKDIIQLVKSKQEVIVTFLAVLELARTQIVTVTQAAGFDDIHITRRLTPVTGGAGASA